MKDLVLSIACLLALLIPWGIYEGHSSHTIDDYKSLIDNRIIPAIEEGDWETADSAFGFIAKDWDRYKKISAYFVDTGSINEVDSVVSKVFYYIRLKDASNSAGEAAYLKYRFDFLHENESPSPANIF